MRPRLLAAVAIASTVVLGACAKHADQGTVRTCFNTIGVREPDPTTLGSVDGWIMVGKQAVAESKDARIVAAGRALLDRLSVEKQKDGFTDAEKDAYAVAVKEMLAACKAAEAFEGDPRKPL